MICSFFETAPLFYQPLHFYRKNLKPPFLQKSWILKPNFIMGEGSNYRTPTKYLNILQHNRTQKSSQDIFLNILQKYYQLPLLGTLGMSGHFHQNSNANLKKLWCLPACKKMNCIHKPSGDNVKMLQTYYFEYLENAWSCPSIMLVLPCTKGWCPKCWNQIFGHAWSHTPKIIVSIWRNL